MLVLTENFHSPGSFEEQVCRIAFARRFAGEEITEQGGKQIMETATRFAVTGIAALALAGGALVAAGAGNAPIPPTWYRPAPRGGGRRWRMRAAMAQTR